MKPVHLPDSSVILGKAFAKNAPKNFEKAKNIRGNLPYKTIYLNFNTHLINIDIEINQKKFLAFFFFLRVYCSHNL